MATFAIKTVISAVDNITGPLAGINKSIKGFTKPFRDLYNSTQKLKKELGFPQVAKSLRSVSTAFGDVANEVESLGTELAVATGAATAAISALAWRTSSVGDAAAKTAQKVGISTQAWTELAHAGDMSGVSASTLQGGLTRLNKNLSEAARGGKNATAMFDYLGISIYDSSGKLKSADTVMSEAADKLNMIDDGAHRSAIAAELFGRSAGPEMLPLLKEGTAGINALREEAAALGIAFNDVEGKESEAFGDSITRVTRAIDGVVFTIGKQLLPTLTDWATELKNLIVENRELIGTKVAEWLEEFKATLPQIKAEITAVWESVKSFALRVDELVQSFGGWKEVLPYIAGGLAAIKLAPLAMAVGSLTSAVVSFGLTLLTTPIGWIALGIAGLVAGFVYLWRNCEGFRNFWIAMWEKVTSYFSGVVERITSAFDKGIIAGISQILQEFSPLKLIVAAMSGIRDYMSSFDIGVGDVFSRAFSGIYEFVTGLDLGFADLIAGIKLIFLNFTPAGWIVSAMDALIAELTGISLVEKGEAIINSLWDGLKSAWEGVFGYFTTAFARIKEAFSTGFLDGMLAVLRNFNPLLFIANAIEAVFEYFTGISLYDVGIGLITGLWDGLKSMWANVTDWLYGAIEELTGWMPDFVKDGLGLSNLKIPAPVVNDISATEPVPMEQYPALQVVQQRAARQQLALDAMAKAASLNASINFNNVPPGVSVESRGWTNQKTSYQPAPILQSPFVGLRTVGMGGNW